MYFFLPIARFTVKAVRWDYRNSLDPSLSLYGYDSSNFPYTSVFIDRLRRPVRKLMAFDLKKINITGAISSGPRALDDFLSFMAERT